MFLLYIAIKRVHFTPAFCCIHIIQLVVPLPHFAVDQVPPPSLPLVHKASPNH